MGKDRVFLEVFRGFSQQVAFLKRSGKTRFAAAGASNCGSLKPSWLLKSLLKLSANEENVTSVCRIISEGVGAIGVVIRNLRLSLRGPRLLGTAQANSNGFLQRVISRRPVEDKSVRQSTGTCACRTGSLVLYATIIIIVGKLNSTSTTQLHQAPLAREDVSFKASIF